MLRHLKDISNTAQLHQEASNSPLQNPLPIASEASSNPPTPTTMTVPPPLNSTAAATAVPGGTSSQSTPTEVLETTPPSIAVTQESTDYVTYCENCRRRNTNESSDFYTIQFTRMNSDDLRRRKFKLFPISNESRTVHDLCEQCSIYLTTNEKSAIKENAWPAFIWKVLNQREVIRFYGNKAWCLIPKQWRHWYLESLRNQQISYSSISIDNPEPSVCDISEKIIEFQHLIKSYSLPKLAEACNRFMIPTVMCPFGCSEFHHKTGHLSLDLIIQRYLQKVTIQLYSDRAGFCYVQNAREDFVEFGRKIETSWLLNEEWRILPSIAFVE